MRRIFSCIAVVALIAIMDLALGTGLDHLYRRTLTGEAGGLINDALTRKAQILLLGSSRMRHHAMPAVLNRKLSLTAFNAGMDGQDFLYAVMLFDLWQRSNSPPKAIVLNVDSDSFQKNDDELQRAEVFSFFYDESPLVREVLNERSRFEWLKFVSRAYRANGKVFAIAKNLLTHPAPDYDGFEPLTGHLTPQTVPARHENVPRLSDFWSLKVEYFKRLADYCKEHSTRLVLVQSPRFREDRRAHDAWVRVLSVFLSAYPNVEFVDLSSCAHPDVFQDKPELFKDGSHLNARGAEIFSVMLSDALQTNPHPDNRSPISPTELTAKPNGRTAGVRARSL